MTQTWIPTPWTNHVNQGSFLLAGVALAGYFTISQFVARGASTHALHWGAGPFRLLVAPATGTGRRLLDE